MKMSDQQVDNIHRIVASEAAMGNIIIGIVAVGDDGNLRLCWATSDTKIAAEFEKAIAGGEFAGREMVSLPKEA